MWGSTWPEDGPKRHTRSRRISPASETKLLLFHTIRKHT